jgi:riboflavin synthase
METIDMFTGIVQGIGNVTGVTLHEAHRRLTIVLPNVEGLNIGASVAIDGVCLTAVAINDSEVHFDVIEETIRRTTLGGLEQGSVVNVERSLKFGDEIGGHLLSGHIMEMGEVIEVKSSSETMDVRLRVSPHVRQYIVEKGYVAINGVSLTIGACDQDSFWLHLIPETLQLTTCDAFTVGQMTNIEIDNTTQVIVETVKRQLGK